MSGHNPTLKNKVSPHIDSQLPDFVREDHALFSLFLKYYYEFLEAGELVVTGSNDYVIEETISKNYILDESGDNVVLETSVGKFVAGETITGAISKATAKILVDDFDNNKRLFITSQQRFVIGETVTGATSGATTTIASYRANPVQNIQQLLAYADVDNTVYSFLDKFRDSFMEALPNTVADGLSKRKLIKNIKDLYSAKGTEAGHKLFFRILFNEEATIIYPRDQLLRPSDGVWSTDKIVRVVENGTSDFSHSVGQLITGQTSGATARVVTVIKFREGAIQIAELNLDINSVNGVFVAGETVTSVDNIQDLEISSVIKSIVVGGAVVSSGAYYTTGDVVTVTGGGGNGEALSIIESAGTGSVDEILIDNGGSGYQTGQELTFNVNNTEGRDVRASIAVVGGGFILEQATSPDHFITEENDNIIFEDRDYARQEETVGELDYLVLESGGQIVIEENTFIDLGVSSEIGEITKVEIINRGNGFITLPTITVSELLGGSGASLYAMSTVAPRIGHVGGISITNFGLNYSASPTFTLDRIVLIKNSSGTWESGVQLTSHNGSVVSYNSNTNLLTLRTQVTLNSGDTVTSITGASATVHQADYATAVSSIGTVGTSSAKVSLTNDRGKLSVDTMKIQDSLYYQDYSYVVRIGQSINEWRESIRRSVHPAGWSVFGEVSFSSLVSATIKNPTAGTVGDYVGDDTYSPELASTFTNLFTTIFGRRLGTTTDSTQRVNASVGVVSSSDLNSGTRDVTLTSDVSVRMNIGRGSHRSGPTLENFAKYAFTVSPVYDSNTFPNAVDPGGRIITSGANKSRDQYTIAQFGYLGIRSVCNADGTIPNSAYTTHINVMPPSEIIISRGARINAFDNDFVTFDDGIQKFDETSGVGIDRDTEGNYSISFDEISATQFDNNTVTFDAASGNEQDYEVKTFDESDDTFDVTTNSFDASNTIGRISLFSADVTTFDKTTETYDTQ